MSLWLTSLTQRGYRTTSTRSYLLIRLREHGGLIPPSAGSIRILCEAERQLRDSMSIQSVNHRISPLHLKLAVQDTINTCDVLDTAGHASRTQTGIETHHEVLIKNIITLFYRSRIDNIIRIHNSRLHIINTRQLNNHLTALASVDW